MTSSRSATPAPTQIWIALPFFIFGFLYLAGSLIWLVANPSLLTGHFYRPSVIAFSHAIGLGFLMSLVAGSSYQLLPVALENPLHSRTLAKIHLVAHVGGVPVMVAGFAHWHLPSIAVGGSAVLIGLLLFAVNVTLTAVKPLRRTPTTIGVLGSVFALCAALTLAGYILLSKFNHVSASDPMTLLGGHTYTILFGFFLPFLAAVSYTLLPMFLLVPLQNTRRAFGSAWYCASSTVLFLAGQLAWPAIVPYAAMALAIGLGLYVAENLAVIRRSPRRLDGSLRLYAWNLAFITPTALLVLARSLQRARHMPLLNLNLDILIFALAVFGTLIPAILGMGAKIVPFLVWQHRYAPLLGRALVPKLAELVFPRVLVALSWFVPFAIVLLTIGILMSSDTTVRLAALCLVGGLVAFLANLTRSLSHLWAPKARPFPGIPSAAPTALSAKS